MGDTLIEVMFAVGVFGLVAVSAISLMNRGLYSAQGALEINMARNEIDAQAEALRFIHNAYVSEQSASSEVYSELWKEIVGDPSDESSTGLVYTPTSLPENFFSNYNDVPCSQIYYNESGENGLPGKSFVINPRLLDSSDLETALAGINGTSNVIIKNTSTNSKLQPSATYPRLLYGSTVANEESDTGSLSDYNTNTNSELYADSNFYSAEGIWVTVVAEGDGVGGANADFIPDYYDFYIRTCWDSPGGGRTQDASSTTISTTIRLYNPDAITLECIVQTVGQTCAPAALEQSGIFIVMSWSGSNSDIDSHLIGPNDGKSVPSAYHVYFGSKTAGEFKTHDYVLADGTRQVVEGYTLQLDVDALGSNYNYNFSTDEWVSAGNSTGKVEVIAIRSLYSSNFHYYVYDWAGGALAGQNLRVRIYVGYAANGVGQWPRYNEPIIDCWYDNTSPTDKCPKGRAGSSGSHGYWDVANIVVEGSGLITTELISNSQSSAPSY